MPMKINKIFILLLVQFMCCCGKADEGFIIAPPTTKPSSGQTDGGNNGGGGDNNGGDNGGDVTPATPPSDGFIVVGYAYADSGALPDPSLLTHINFSFAKIQDDFETLSIRSSKQTRLRQIVALKDKNPKLKVLLSVGGWGAGNFSEMAADETHRKKFCQNCLKAVNDYKLDGIDIDWEYPGSSDAGISSSSNDKKNFTLLLKDLRSVLGNDKLLTMASEASAGYIDWASALQYLNFVNIMSYDMGRPPTHNAALYNKDSRTKMSCEEAVAKHYAKGIPYNKMTLGMAFFGRVDRNILKGDELDYNEIIALTGFTKCWDDNAKVPYLTDASGTMVLSYDDEQSIGLKAEYVKSKGLLGGMYWDIEADDANHTLGKAVAGPLLGWKDEQQQASAFLATNQYVQKYLEEVNYPNTNNSDTDKEYYNSLVSGYPGGGPSKNNEEIPPTYTIKWTASSSGTQKLTVWEGDWSRDYSLSSGVKEQGITNLVPNKTYHWQVTVSNSVIANGQFETRGLLHQVFFEPNVRNGRDLGGWKGLDGKTVVYRKLFRGGVLKEDKEGEYLNDAGKKEMRAQGIKAELDLQEEEAAQTTSPLGSDIAFYAPHFDSGWNTMVRDNPGKVKDSFCWIVARLRENKPVYFHCWSGRDRTGTMAVLLLGTLGVSESDMAKDFECTYFSPKSWSMYNGSYHHTRDSYSYRSIRKTIFSKTDSGTYQERIVKYLLGIGVLQQDIDDLRSIMLK